MVNRVKTLAIGWYNHNNLGDELFKKAFVKIFPELDFIFSDIITDKLLDEVSVVFFGGGSFLSEKPNIENIDKLLQKKIFYIGVGLETQIHPTHLLLMKRARLLAVRSDLEKALSINFNSIYIPDLVFSLDIISGSKINNSVLIIPNISVIPSWNDSAWKHSAWNYFKLEFAQFLDYLIESNYKINFFAMCFDSKHNDNNAVGEIISAMKYKNNYDSIYYASSCSQYEMIISQRYHGTILAEMNDIPYMSIFGHDKMKQNYYNRGVFLSYYGVQKSDLINKFNQIRSTKLPPIVKYDFSQLNKIVMDHLCQSL